MMYEVKYTEQSQQHNGNLPPQTITINEICFNADNEQEAIAIIIESITSTAIAAGFGYTYAADAVHIHDLNGTVRIYNNFKAIPVTE